MHDCGCFFDPGRYIIRKIPLDKMTFRFNNRANPCLFRDALIKLLESPVLEYTKLTAA